MLKVCWDCIVGGGRDNDTTYNSRLNGNNSYNAQWTSVNQEKMFKLPKQMNASDGIQIAAVLNRIESFTFTLFRQNQREATKLEINFSDDCVYEHTEDGNRTVVSETPPSNLITEPEFTLCIDVMERDDENMLKISIGVSYLCSLFLNNTSSISFFNFSDNVSVSQLTFSYMRK